MVKKSVEVRFQTYVNKGVGADDCWLWVGGHLRGGYGCFALKKGRAVRAHRYAYEVEYGPILDGLMVLHKCDVRLCVRPSHLFLGTNRDNVADMLAKGRSLKGTKNPQAKLTAADVENIKTRYAQGGISQKSLGALYGVDQTTVGDLVRGESYANSHPAP